MQWVLTVPDEAARRARPHPADVQLPAFVVSGAPGVPGVFVVFGTPPISRLIPPGSETLALTWTPITGTVRSSPRMLVPPGTGTVAAASGGSGADTAAAAGAEAGGTGRDGGGDGGADAAPPGGLGASGGAIGRGARAEFAGGGAKEVTGDAWAGRLSVCGRLEVTGDGIPGAETRVLEAGAAVCAGGGSTGAEVPMAAGEGAATEGAADGAADGPKTDRGCPPIARAAAIRATVAADAATTAACWPRAACRATWASRAAIQPAADPWPPAEAR